MEKDKIDISDWQRVLVGEVPGHFYLEIVFRIAFIYLVLMIAMRLMGKKMASQLNSSQMAAIVSLAAATGIPILAPDRGLLPVVIIAVIVVGLERLVSWLSSNNQRAEKLFQGDISSLVKNGVMQIDEMGKPESQESACLPSCVQKVLPTWAPLSVCTLKPAAVFR